MKKTLAILALSSLALMAADTQQSPLTGFLGVESCVQSGAFADCNLKEYRDGGKVVAVIDGQTYPVDKGVLPQSKIDQFIMKGNLTFDGTIETGILHLSNIELTKTVAVGPKEKFKGCM